MQTLTSSLTITRPDDWHIHLRDGDALAAVVPATAAVFARAMAMPNLKPPTTTVAAAQAYQDRIQRALDASRGAPMCAPVVDIAATGSRSAEHGQTHGSAPTSAFTPLLSLYLTDNTPPSEIFAAQKTDFIVGAKYYPAGATTNSDSGVTGIDKCLPALEAMAECGFVLQIHGEVTDAAVDVFDREARFIDDVLMPLMQRLPALKVVFEHITTAQAVQCVLAHPSMAATITPQHMLWSRNELFVGGIRPHHYCLPVLKRDTHRDAVLAAAISGSPQFFLGTDSAPHARHTKETTCGCAGRGAG